jgi:PhnB protein
MTTLPNASLASPILSPYAFFYGRCIEALEFYKRTLGGDYEAECYGDSPMSEHVAPDMRDTVLHARFAAPGIVLFASDGRERKPVDPDAGNISLSLTYDNRADCQRTFAALSAEAKVIIPLEEAVWGSMFGMLQDRFGIEWMVSAP